MMKKNKLIAISFATAMVLFSGCGGGSSSSSVSDDKDPTTPPTTQPTEKPKTDTSISGKAVDGYLMNSAICLDLDLNGYCNDGEPRGFTNDDGSFKLDVTAEQKANANYNKAPLIVFGGRDSDKPSEDFIGKLKAPNDGSGNINITPLTTLVSAYLAQDNNVTIEDAKSKVAKKLNLTADQIDEDPRESNNVELLKATQMIQKAVNTMVETAKKGSTETKKGAFAEDIMTSFAAGLDNVTDGQDIDKAVKEIVEKADTTKLKVVNPTIAEKSKVLATKNVKLVADVLDSSSGELSDEEVKEAMLKVSIVSSQIQKEIKTLDVTSDSFDINITIPDLNSTEEIAKLEKEMILFDAGVDVTANDFNISKYDDLNVSVDLDIDELHKELEEYAKDTNDTIITDAVETLKEKITEESNQEANLEKQIALEEAYTKAANLDDKVEVLLSSDIVASSDDAKNLVAQLRETADTFIDDENEFNTNTIVGQQNAMITTKIQPTVEGIASNFEASSTALETSVNAFNASLETNFDEVLGTINTRLTNISEAIDTATEDKNETESWEARSDGDTISYTYSINDNNISTEVISFNESNTTIQLNTNIKDSFDLIIADLNNPILLKGTGYDLNVTSLSFEDNKATFKASGSITGKDGASMKLDALELTIGIDKDAQSEDDMITSISSKFDGTITSAGKSVQGILNISNAQSSIQGIYKDDTNEISFDGTITAQLDLNDAKNMEGKTDWVDPQALVMVTFDNNETSFVTSFSQSWDTNNTYTFFTQADRNVTCTQADNYNDESHTYNNNFACTGGKVTPYYGKNKTLVATVNGEKKVIEYAYRGFNGQEQEIHVGFNHGEETYLDNGKLQLDGEDINITNITVTDAKTLKDIAASLNVNGKLTHNSKTIELLNTTIKKIANTDTIVFNANGLEISNANGSVKMTSLDLTTTINDNHNHVEHSMFETYTVNYDQDNDEPQFNNIDLKGLSINIDDNSSNTLSVNADITYNKDTSNNEAIVFNGAYSYANTSFKGLVDVKGNKEAGNSKFTVSGDVNSSDGFEPFNITIVGSTTTDHEIKAKSLFTRGANEAYKLAITVDGNETAGTFKLADNNGVHATYNETGSSEGKVTLTDKDGNPIATIDGNTVKYSDNSTETLSW